LRPRPMSRAAVTAGALCLATTGATGTPAAAQTDSQGATPRASVAAVGVSKKRLHVRAGRRVAVVGAVRPGAAGLKARLQIRRGGRWATIDRDRTAGSGRYLLRDRRQSPMSARARVRVSRVEQRLGRVNVYRWASASWYGPGLYGNRTGCGGTLHAGRVGVAHKWLPCGSRLTLRHRGRTVRVRVIDRGPYVGGREYDLTERTAERLRFRGHGPILTTR
jgi:rare lipoprotein A